MPQMVRALRTILGMETLGTMNTLSPSKHKEDSKVKQQGSPKPSGSTRKPTVEDEVDALEVNLQSKLCHHQDLYDRPKHLMHFID